VRGFFHNRGHSHACHTSGAISSFSEEEAQPAWVQLFGWQFEFFFLCASAEKIDFFPTEYRA
jgi:hypothetical protein